MSILVDETTRVVVAGVTGWQARAHTGFMRSYGTRVVAGVVPGRGGEDCDGVPVYDSFATALKDHQADAAVLFVPAAAAAESAIEAAGAGVGLILVCAEGVPQHDVARMIAHARRAGVRLVGPNSQGVISPGRAKMGGTGGDLPVMRTGSPRGSCGWWTACPAKELHRRREPMPRRWRPTCCTKAAPGPWTETRSACPEPAAPARRSTGTGGGICSSRLKPFPAGER